MQAGQAPPTPVQPQAAPAAGGGRAANTNDAFYQLGPDSQSRDDVPHGRIDGPFTLSTTVYSGPVPASTSQGQNGIWGWDDTNPAARVPVNVSCTTDDDTA